MRGQAALMSQSANIPEHNSAAQIKHHDANGEPNVTLSAEGNQKWADEGLSSSLV